MGIPPLPLKLTPKQRRSVLKKELKYSEILWNFMVVSFIVLVIVTMLSLKTYYERKLDMSLDKPVIKVLPTEEEKGRGLASTIFYDNNDFILAMRNMFKAQRNEEIIQIEIGKESITARFR